MNHRFCRNNGHTCPPSGPLHDVGIHHRTEHDSGFLFGGESEQIFLQLSEFSPGQSPPRPSSFPLSPAPASQEARASKHPLFLRSSSCEISRWKFTRRRDSPATALALAARVGGNQAIRWRSRQWDEGRCGATRSGAAPQISDIANKTGFSKRGTTGYTCNSLGFLQYWCGLWFHNVISY